MIRNTESLFHNVKSNDDWEVPTHGHRDKLINQLTNAQLAMENAISQDRSLSKVGRSILLNILTCSRQGADAIVRFIDKTHRELIKSNYTPAKAWHLVSMLITRVFEDIFQPRVGKLQLMETKNPDQVAAVACHSSLRCLEVLKKCLDLEIGKHPNIASEYVKFISHNTPCQLVESLELKVKKVEEKLSEQNAKYQSQAKQVNATTQKVEKHDSKISGLETRVGRLEKK